MLKVGILGVSYLYFVIRDAECSFPISVHMTLVKMTFIYYPKGLAFCVRFGEGCSLNSLNFMWEISTIWGTSLAVQRLRLNLLSRGCRLNPGWGAEIPNASQPNSPNIKQKQYCSKFSKDFKIGPHPKNLLQKGNFYHFYSCVIKLNTGHLPQARPCAKLNHTSWTFIPQKFAIWLSPICITCPRWYS